MKKSDGETFSREEVKAMIEIIASGWFRDSQELSLWSTGKTNESISFVGYCDLLTDLCESYRGAFAGETFSGSSPALMKKKRKEWRERLEKSVLLDEEHDKLFR